MFRCRKLKKNLDKIKKDFKDLKDIVEEKFEDPRKMQKPKDKEVA